MSYLEMSDSILQGSCTCESPDLRRAAKFLASVFVLLTTVVCLSQDIEESATEEVVIEEKDEQIESLTFQKLGAENLLDRRQVSKQLESIRIDDELIVTEKRHTFKSYSQIMDGYRANTRGGYYYSRGDYEKAFPLLLHAAREGFKPSQARLSILYFNGLGGAEKNWVEFVGWLGASASRKSKPEYMNAYKRLRKAIPEDKIYMIDDIVDTYVSRYGSKATGVNCEINQRAGSHFHRFSCHYEDEYRYQDPFAAFDETSNVEDVGSGPGF